MPPTCSPSNARLLQPFLFISRKSVPLLRANVEHLKERMKTCNIEDVKMDNLGYYITFPNLYQGQMDAQLCYKICNRKAFSSHTIVLRPFFCVREDSAPWRQIFPNAPASRRRSPHEALAEKLARLFGYNSMEHFMRSINLKFLDKCHYKDAEALLISWRTEAAYVRTRC